MTNRTNVAEVRNPAQWEQNEQCHAPAPPGAGTKCPDDRRVLLGSRSLAGRPSPVSAPFGAQLHHVVFPHTLRLTDGLEDVDVAASIDLVEQSVDVTSVHTSHGHRAVKLTKGQRAEVDAAALAWCDEAWGTR